MTRFIVPTILIFLLATRVLANQDNSKVGKLLGSTSNLLNSTNPSLETTYLTSNKDLKPVTVRMNILELLQIKQRDTMEEYDGYEATVSQEGSS